MIGDVFSFVPFRVTGAGFYIIYSWAYFPAKMCHRPVFIIVSDPFISLHFYNDKYKLKITDLFALFSVMFDGWEMLLSKR